jgi:hypothetical protein
VVIIHISLSLAFLVFLSAWRLNFRDKNRLPARQNHREFSELPFYRFTQTIVNFSNPFQYVCQITLFIIDEFCVFAVFYKIVIFEKAMRRFIPAVKYGVQIRDRFIGKNI